MGARNFDALLKEATGEPLSFVLGGITFYVPLPLAVWPLLELTEASDKEGMEAVAAFTRLVTSYIKDDQEEAFREACTRSRIDMETLAELVKWITEEATGLPTEPQSNSAELRQSNVPESMPDSSQPELADSQT